MIATPTGRTVQGTKISTDFHHQGRPVAPPNPAWPRNRTCRKRLALTQGFALEFACKKPRRTLRGYNV